MCPKRYKYIGFRDYQQNHFLFLNGPSEDPGGSREGSKIGGGAPAGSQGPLGPFFARPGFAKRSQGLNFDVNP